MWQPLLSVVGASLVAAHTLMDAEWQPAERSFVDTFLTPRGATQCGPSYGNQVCDPGVCCSSSGQCGTGCAAPDCLFQYGPGCDANQTPPGTNTTSVSRPQFGSVPYGTTIVKCNTPGKVALTFDDGPYLYTNDLLDLLKTNNVKATFFMVANNGGKGQIELESTGWPTVMRRVIAEGHQIGSHSWSHQSLDALTPQQVYDQVIKNEIAFSDVFGFFPTYFRPPYGFCSSSTCQGILGSLGYHIIQWNVDTLDWQENYPNSQSIFSSAIKSSNPSTDSFIPLTHDIHYGTVHGFVQFMLDTLHAAGYTTALVGECLNDPPANWYRDAKSGQQYSSSVTTQAATTSSASTSTPAPTTTQQVSTTSQAPPTTSSDSSSSSTTSSSTSSSSALPTTSSTSSSSLQLTSSSSSSSSTLPVTSSTSSSSLQPATSSTSSSSSTPTTSSTTPSSSSQGLSSSVQVTSSTTSSSSSHVASSSSSVHVTSSVASQSGSPACSGLAQCIMAGLSAATTTTTVPAFIAKNGTTATTTSTHSTSSVSATLAATGAASRLTWQALPLCAVLLSFFGLR